MFFSANFTKMIISIGKRQNKTNGPAVKAGISRPEILAVCCETFKIQNYNLPLRELVHAIFCWVI
jgi:hypothetical protein